MQHVSVAKTKELFLNCSEAFFSCLSPILFAQAVKRGNLDLLTPCNLPKKVIIHRGCFWKSNRKSLTQGQAPTSTPVFYNF